MVLALATLMALASCRAVEPGIEGVVPLSGVPRADYLRGLERAGLDGSALVSDWRMSGDAALRSPARIPVAYRETVSVDLAGTAHAWRLPVRRGHRVRIEIEGNAPELFLDAYGVRSSARSESEDDVEELGHAERGARAFSVDPDFDGDVVVRAQPAVLADAGRFTIVFEVGPSFAFPVVGRGVPDIGSVFGDQRDGGARDHHGIDIFAPRRTPVVAASPGRVSRVETTPIGGRVVWMRTDGSRSVYYAHLDSQMVAEGMRVEIGDTLGLVGNTGNARTTPPHLHFGIYSRGPVDPMPFVRPASSRPADPSGDSLFVGASIRTTSNQTELRAAPESDVTLGAALSLHAPLTVLGATAGWLRVATVDGLAGFMPARAFERTEEPLEARRLREPSLLRAGPHPGSAVLTTLATGSDVTVLARLDGAVWVREAESRATGWLEVGD